MYRLDREEFVQTKYTMLWALLAFQAGYLNAFGFLACGRYVSHVTGVGTQLGVAMASNAPLLALELLGFPAFFILGSFLSGVLTISRIERRERPRFDLVTFILPAGIGLLLVLGTLGTFGPFGENLVLPRDAALLYLLSMLCGMQNGCFATMTKGQIRTTHLTGISTDIGTDLSRLWFGRLEGRERRLTERTNRSRLKTFLAFGLGSIASVVVSQQLNYGALAFPLFIAIAVAVRVRQISLELDERFGSELAPAASASASSEPTLARRAEQGRN